MFSYVPIAVWIGVIGICGLITVLVIWATNKGYSKKWDEEDGR